MFLYFSQKKHFTPFLLHFHFFTLALPWVCSCLRLGLSVPNPYTSHVIAIWITAFWLFGEREKRNHKANDAAWLLALRNVCLSSSLKSIIITLIPGYLAYINNLWKGWELWSLPFVEHSDFLVSSKKLHFSSHCVYVESETNVSIMKIYIILVLFFYSIFIWFKASHIIYFSFKIWFVIVMD